MNLQKLIEDFFLNVRPTRSQWWINKIHLIVQKTIYQKKITDEQIINGLIKSIHVGEDKKMFLTSARNAVKRDSILVNDRRNYKENIKDVRQELLIRFSKSYKPEKGNEEQFLNGKISLNIVSDFKRINYPYIEEKINLSAGNKINSDDVSKIQTIRRPIFKSWDDKLENAKIFSEEMEMNFHEEHAKNYLSILAEQAEANPKANEWFYSLYRHLTIRQSGFLNERKLPDIIHNYSSPGFINPQYEYLRDIDDAKVNIPGYLKYYAIVYANERYFMLKSIEILRECRNFFEEKLLPELIKGGKAEKDVRSNIPLLSAVAVSKENKIIKTAFKGETGCLGNHCEYTLFEEFLAKNQENYKLIGGTLYVTLEPCNKRGYFIDAKNEKKPKVPCAVRCVESGINRIFIGIFDPNKEVEWKGIEILETGVYTFNLKGGNIIGTNEKETLAANLLKEDFESKGYQVIEKTGRIIKYKIGNPIEVNFFHPDLSLEIMTLNSDFIGENSKKAFPLTQLLK